MLRNKNSKIARNNNKFSNKGMKLRKRTYTFSKVFPTVKSNNLWNNLLRSVEETPSPGTFRSRLDKTLANV